MSNIIVEISGSYQKTGIPVLDKKIDKLAGKTFLQLSEGLTNKTKENASGGDLPKIAPDQGPNIGRSQSGYNPTGELKEGISLTIQNPSGENFKAEMESKAEHSSMVEWGTGVRGETPYASGRLIFPQKGQLMVFEFQGKTIAVPYILGMQPRPFVRGAIDFVRNKWKEIVK